MRTAKDRHREEVWLKLRPGQVTSPKKWQFLGSISTEAHTNQVADTEDV